MMWVLYARTGFHREAQSWECYSRELLARYNTLRAISASASDRVPHWHLGTMTEKLGAEVPGFPPLFGRGVVPRDLIGGIVYEIYVRRDEPQ